MNQSENTEKRGIQTQADNRKGETKKVKKIKKNTNPFQDLPLGEQYENENDNSDWIKSKKTPLTISIANYSKVNKYYSHKSLQKYIRYLYANTCPNPLWLSIKRQSQIQHIVYLDIEVENSLFTKHLNSEMEEEKVYLQFLRQFNQNQRKAIFRQSPFINEGKDVWQALFCYDQESIKSKQPQIKNVSLESKLTQELYEKYFAYTLTKQQMKFNLYPIEGLPAYKDYRNFIDFDKTNISMNNTILIVDCEMVMSSEGFELARVSIMNFEGENIYDKFFKPDKQITNYNTQFSGITEQILQNVNNKISDLHRDLENMIGKGTILVGHSLQNDLHSMKIIYDKVIDTSVLFARKNGSKMKLKTIALKLLNRTIQVGKHCSEQDCRATLDILRYRIQIQQNQESEKQMNLLHQLIEQKKKILLIDSEVDFLKHQQEFNAIHFQKCQPDILPNEILSLGQKYFDKSVNNPDIVFSRLRKPTRCEWQVYYENMDDSLRSLYNYCPDKSVFFLNFQVNNNYMVYPQEEDQERKRTFCLICVKSE